MTEPIASSQLLAKPLSGLSILITRPLQQADALKQLLNQQGADVLHQPAIQIDAAFNPMQTALLQQLASFNYLVFISKNAVTYGLELLNKAGGISQNQVIAAVGKATAEALVAHGFTNIICPESSYDSEALLNMAELAEKQICEKRILIIRGGTGREHLKQSLEQRHADVHYLDVYQRSQPALTLALSDIAKLDIITVSSQQGLENLVKMLTGDNISLVVDKLLITPSDRCSEKARALGFKQIKTAANATDNAMLDCIIKTVATEPELNKP